MSVLTPQTMQERLTHLGTLERGWLGDDEGEPIDAGYLRHVGDVLHRLVNERAIPRPYIYPTPEGLIQCEWDCTDDDRFFCVVFGANRTADVSACAGKWHCAYVSDDDAIDFIAEHAPRSHLVER